MKIQKFCIFIPIFILFTTSLLFSIGDDDPYNHEKEKVLELVINKILQGKTDDVEILINEIPRDPNLTTTVEDLDGIVGQPDDWTWLAVIDDQPGSYMRHPTRWVFTDFDGSIIIEMKNKNSLPKLHMDGQRVRFEVLLDFIPQLREMPERVIPEPPAGSSITEEYTYDNYYAVIIQGDLPGGGDSYNEFWLDNVIMYQTLLEYGYTPENIHVLYGNGVDEEDFPCEWYLETMTDYPAYKQDVRNIFTWMRDGNPEEGIAQVTANDFIYLYTFDHGGSQGGWDVTLCMMDGCMPDDEFASYFNDIAYLHRSVAMQQCHSGGFIDELENEYTVIMTAARHDESAWEADESEECNGHTMHHGEFNYWFMSAMRGHKPKPGEEPVDEDRNSDGKVSFWESYNYVIENDDRNEHPQFSDLGGLGDTLSLQTWEPDGPALFHDSHVIDDSAGNGDGIADAGENITMPTILKNTGTGDAAGISGELSCYSSYITITDSYADFPDIIAGGAGESLPDHYAWHADPDTPPETKVRFRIDWTTNGGTHSGATFFDIKIAAVDLVMDHHEIDDSSSSEPDGAADAGESINMPVTLRNDGNGTGYNLVGMLTTTSPWVLITDDTAEFPDIPGETTGRSLSPHFAYTIDADCPEGTWIDFTVHVSGDLNYEKDLPLQVLVGSRGQVLIIEDGGGNCTDVFEQVLSDRAFEKVRTTADSYDYSTWYDYDFIIWSSGENANPAANATYRTDLENFVAAGGHLLIEGGELANDHDTEHPSFAQNVLHIDSWYTHSGGNLELVASDHPISFFPNELPALLTHSYSSYGEDVCTIRSDSTCVYQWTDHPIKGGIIAFDDNEASGDGGQIAFLSFGIDSVDGGGPARDDLIDNIASWLSTSYKLRYESHVIDDSDPNYGNGDGIVDNGEIVTMPVTLSNNTLSAASAVSAVLSSSTPGVTIHTNYATFPDISGEGSSTSFSPHLSFSTEGNCGSRIVFSLTVYHDDGLTSMLGFSVPIGERLQDIFLDDDMETDLGWTTSSSEGANGLWVREDPYEVRTDTEELVQPEDDTTPDPGVRCWVTGNPRPKGNFKPTDGDVDHTVTLYSPLFSASGGEDVTLHYQRFFYYTSGGWPSSNFTAAYSTDGGTSWITLETLSQQLNSWNLVEFYLKNISSEMKLRFQVKEAVMPMNDLLLEVLIDDVTVDGYNWFCDDFTLPGANPPNLVGDTLILSKVEAGTMLEWQAPTADATHDPATFYRVYRSNSPNGEFIEIGAPTTTYHVDSGSAGELSCYYVEAENGGGPEQ